MKILVIVLSVVLFGCIQKQAPDEVASVFFKLIEEKKFEEHSSGSLRGCVGTAAQLGLSRTLPGQAEGPA